VILCGRRTFHSHLCDRHIDKIQDKDLAKLFYLQFHEPTTTPFLESANLQVVLSMFPLEWID
jgi:hypothetical protein